MKKNGDGNGKEGQIEMFPVDPEIRELGIVEFRLKGAVVEAALVGATNVVDVARLTLDAWRTAVADWLLRLYGGDVVEAQMELERLWAKSQAAFIAADIQEGAKEGAH
jgi:hypothetical protein